MRLASVLVGILVGLGAIVFAWCSRTPGRQRSWPPPPAAVGERPGGEPGAAQDLAWLRLRGLAIPVEGLSARDLKDTFDEIRDGHRRHEALDILAPRGRKVIAADDGTVVKLVTSSRGGRSVYQFDPSSSYCYYYAHLDRYALRLREGLVLRKGETIGYVGTSGNASWRTPHLHFAVLKLGPEKAWWRGTALNAFRIWVPRE
jgi:murein DD-endopeptidase MepM/ murein hydrolase activator NlpD